MRTQSVRERSLRVIKFVVFWLPIMTFSAYAAETLVTFSPAVGMNTTVRISGGYLIWEVTRRDVVKRGRVSLGTEKASHVVPDNYDFTGHIGFSVWHVDDGM